MSVTDSDSSEHFPTLALFILGLTAFIVIVTETLPAGLLPQIATGLGTSVSNAGQLVSTYALGTTLTVVPLIAWTRMVRRKTLLLVALAGFLISNTVTALVPVLAVTLVARAVAGIFAGLVWGMIATYAAGIAPRHLTGRAVAVALAGTPIALAAGTPAATWLGLLAGWQAAFWFLSALTVAAIALTLRFVPDLPGQPRRRALQAFTVVKIAGVLAILAVVFTWVAAHNIAYTYIVPILGRGTTGLRPEAALFIFGVASFVGLWLTGTFIDRSMRGITLIGTLVMVLGAAGLWLLPNSLPGTIVAIALWGAAFGGAPTQVQMAMTQAAGTSADMAIALLTTMFNGAIFTAAAAGSIVLAGLGASWLPAAMTALAVGTVAIVFFGRNAAFPSNARRRAHAEVLRMEQQTAR